MIITAKKKAGKDTIPKSRAQRSIAVLIALVFCAVYSAYSYFQYRHFITPSWDLGIFTQLAKAYANLQLPPIVDIKGAGFSLWGDHFHPILILLAPFYWLFPSPVTLLYLQNGLVAASVYAVCRFAQQVLSPVAAVSISIAYGLSYGIQNAVSVQFHEVAFALPFLAMSLGYLVLSRREENRHRTIQRAVWWAVPLVFVKEDLGITVAVIGLVALARTGWFKTAVDIIFPRPYFGKTGIKQRGANLQKSWISTGSVAESSLLVLWGISWSVLAVTVILPAFNTGGVFDYADKIDIAEALGDPLQSLAQMFFPWQKTISWGLLLLAGAGLWIISPLALIAVPTLTWRFLSSNEGYWESTWHYSLVLMPVIFMGLLDTLERTRRTPQKIPGMQKTNGRLLTFIQGYRAYVRSVVPILTLIISVGMLPHQPLWHLTDRTFATSTLSTADRTKQAVIDSIPAGTTVAADLSVLTYLIPNHTVYWIGHEGEPAPDYVVIDRAGTAWGNNPPADPVAYSQDHFGHSYRIAEHIGSIYVVQRTD